MASLLGLPLREPEELVCRVMSDTSMSVTRSELLRCYYVVLPYKLDASMKESLPFVPTLMLSIFRQTAKRLSEEAKIER